jgi:heme a synthase
MIRDRRFVRWATVTLIALYLVVVAGAVVRATGSGMGCPDWPRCFGYYIPPTDPFQLEFHPQQEYRKGIMIIRNDTLWRATTDFTSTADFNRSNWEKYPKHDYAKFVWWQTWVEYVNRLLGALSGLCMLVLALMSLRYWKTDRTIVYALIVAFLMILFVSWLGAIVVATNLKPWSITLHMLSALIMIAVVLYVQSRVPLKTGLIHKSSITRRSRLLLAGALVLTLSQTIFGTRVRQQIDTIKNNMDGLSRETWIEQLDSGYLLHMLTAAITLLLNSLLCYLLWKQKPQGMIKWLTIGILLFVWGEYGAGVLMHNFAIPSFVQPVHLVFAVVLFGLQFAYLMRTKSH